MKHFVPALLISLAVSSFNPGYALAATPVGTPAGSDASTHPVVMQQAANDVATAPTGALQPFRPVSQVAVGGSGGPQREVFGFALLSSLADPTIGYPSWNFSLLSTVAVFGLHVNSGDGNFAVDTGWNVWNSSQMTDLVTKAHGSGTKVVVTIILQDFCVNNPAKNCPAGNPTPEMCAGLANRANTVAQTIAQVKARGVDGVNVDYEGLQVTCANGINPRTAMTDLVQRLRIGLTANVPASSYLSVDTYSSSAGDPAGFFDVAALKADADSFFVMAYDSDWSNYNKAPLSCSSYCLNPVSPLSGYYYNDTRAASEYVAVAGAGKVILGLPYYSRGACVSNFGPNQPPIGGSSTWAQTYRTSVTMATDPSNSGYQAHRDANDGATGWATWTSNNTACHPMEMYWDDVASLGQKYDLVNRDGLRGVGLWNLNFGGGAPELWANLSTYFSCPVTLSGPTAPPTSTQFSVGINPGGCAVSSFDVQQFDRTLSKGWYGLPQLGGGARSLVAEGYPGYTYQFRVRAHATSGVVGAWATATVTVAAGATSPHPFKGLYTLDGFGGVQSADSPPLTDSAYWGGWNIARTAKALPGTPQSGFVLDGYGGLHSYGAPGLTETTGPAGHRWGWDIARDFAFLPNGLGGYVLDGYGGLHAFAVNGATSPPPTVGNPYWGWDIARKVVIFSDGSGGYVLDGWGGLHPFGINGPAPVQAASLLGGGYWPGWDIAHDVVLVPGNANHSGYTLDGYGGVHPFHPSGDGSTMPAPIQSSRWSWDIARSLWLLPGSASAGYTMDGYGGLHPFGGAPSIASASYWPGWDIAKVAWGA